MEFCQRPLSTMFSSEEPNSNSLLRIQGTPKLSVLPLFALIKKLNLASTRVRIPSFDNNLAEYKDSIKDTLQDCCTHLVRVHWPSIDEAIRKAGSFQPSQSNQYKYNLRFIQHKVCLAGMEDPVHEDTRKLLRKLSLQLDCLEKFLTKHVNDMLKCRIVASSSDPLSFRTGATNYLDDIVQDLLQYLRLSDAATLVAEALENCSFLPIPMSSDIEAQKVKDCMCVTREPFRNHQGIFWVRFPYHFCECEAIQSHILPKGCHERSSTSHVKPAISTVSCSLTEIFPLEMWHKILAHLDNDDGCIFALLQATESFLGVFPPATALKVTDYRFWSQSLTRIGFFDETAQTSTDEAFWRRKYHNTVQSMACFKCFLHLRDSQGKPVDRSPHYLTRIYREVEKFGRAVGPSVVVLRQPAYYLRDDVLDVQCCNVDPSLAPLLQKISDVIITFLGSPGTPYMGGRFRLLLQYPSRYPFEAPRARLLTKIFSPYFTKHGDFYFPYTKVIPSYYEFDYWTASCDIGGIVDLVGEYLSLSVPVDSENQLYPAKFVCGKVVNEEVGGLFRNDRQLFDHLALEFTHAYAMENWKK